MVHLPSPIHKGRLNSLSITFNKYAFVLLESHLHKLGPIFFRVGCGYFMLGYFTNIP